MTSDYLISAVIRSHKLPVGLQFFNQETAFLGSSFVRIESAAHAAMVSVCVSGERIGSIELIMIRI